MNIRFKKYFITLILLIFVGGIHLWYASKYKKNESFPATQITSHDNYESFEEIVFDPVFYQLGIPIFIAFLFLIVYLTHKYYLNKKWKNFSRDIILIFIISYLTTTALCKHFFSFEFFPSFFLLFVLFYALIVRIKIQYKKHLIYNKKKKDLSIYNDKLREYINIPLTKGNNIKWFHTEYGVLIIESTNLGEDDNPIISELNYFESNFELTKWAIKNKHDPSIIVVVDWRWGNEKARITFVDYEEQETNGAILMDFSHIKKGEKFNLLGDRFNKEVKEEILYVLNNLDEIYKINFIDSYSDNPKLVNEYFQNGNISCTGFYDTYNNRIGEWKYFYENGIIRERIEYNEGRKTRKWVKYFEDGKPFIESNAGEKKEFWKNGNLKIDLLNDNSGNLLHKKEFWENGNIKLEEINDNDEKILYKEYDIDGNLIIEKEHYKSNFPY